MDGKEMICDECGEVWNFAGGEWDVNQNNEEYKTHVCPECHGTLYFKEDWKFYVQTKRKGT
jgi:hypothetical protein